MSPHHKSSDEIEREIEQQRTLIEYKVDALASRFSPGQMLDEALRFTRTGPAADFKNNLGRSIVENPLPVTLLGAGLAWLAVQSNLPRSENRTDPDYEPYLSDDDDFDDDYPVTAVEGPWLQRVGYADIEGTRHAEFIDDAGRKFRALTDDTGNRAGHFIDESGRMFRGFIDKAGHRITDFRDEAGNRIARTTGWASHSWRKAEDRAAKLGERMREGADKLGEEARHAGDRIRSGAGHMGGTLRESGERAMGAADSFVHNQPLAAGILAAAAGAALALLLPRTTQEDEAFGASADKMRRTAARQASHLYEEGKEMAEQLHGEAREAVSEAYKDMKDTVRHAGGQDSDEHGKATHH